MRSSFEVVGNQLSGSAIRYQAPGIRYQVPRRRNRLPHPESIPRSIGPYAWHPSGRRLSEWLLANPSRPVYLFLIHATSSCPDPGAPARECRKAFAASSPRPVRHLPSILRPTRRPPPRRAARYSEIGRSNTHPTARMSPTRREVLTQLAAVAVLPLRGWVRTDQDPLDGTIADYQAGRRRGAWTAVEVTTRALERCRADGILIGVLVCAAAGVRDVSGRVARRLGC